MEPPDLTRNQKLGGSIIKEKNLNKMKIQLASFLAGSMSLLYHDQK